MKSFYFILICIFLSSCQKEFLNPSNIIEFEILEESSIPIDDCPYEDIETIMIKLQDIYQPLANENCDTLLVEILACDDSQIISTLVVIAPNIPSCIHGNYENSKKK